MKKNKIVYFIIFTSLHLATSCTRIKAQQPFRQLIINAGLGYSPGFNGDITFFNSHAYPVEKSNPSVSNFNFTCSSITPNLGAVVEYCFYNRFSLGIASSYQSEIVTWNIYYSLHFTDKITRINFAARLLYHLKKNTSAFDPYIGIRPGFCYWNDRPSAYNLAHSVDFPNPTFFLENPHYFISCLQVLFGLRIYFNEKNRVGINLEAGIGQPYLFEGGLTFRINTHKGKAAPPEGEGGNEIK